MSKLKNIFGIPQSLIDAATEIHEKSHNLSPGQERIANMAGDRKTIGADDFAVLRRLHNTQQKSNKTDGDPEKKPTNNQSPHSISKPSKSEYPDGFVTPKPSKSEYPDGFVTPKPPKMKSSSVYYSMNKESAQLDELSPAAMINYAQKASASKKPGEAYPKRDEMISKAINKADQKIKKGEGEVVNTSLKEYNYSKHSTGLYPYGPNNSPAALAQLKSILRYLFSDKSILKLVMDEFQIDGTNIIEELDLLEYRTKGAVGKKKAAAASTSSAPAPKKSDDDEEEDEGPSYEPASGKDQEHIMTQLKGAMDDERGGRHIDTASGKKYVTKSTASKIHSHLMGLKAPERAQSSSDLYNLKATHPMTKHIQDDHRSSLERGIKAPSDKKGRGRPKKAAD